MTETIACYPSLRPRVLPPPNNFFSRPYLSDRYKIILLMQKL
ncbi:MAG: hypothetical protein QNJ68_12980 [Microcoleaceae cyanobacterium MO_207.B10]|nr:hypothetical protein [Microcoleaceae cyanobacterium MO_207.B10]